MMRESGSSSEGSVSSLSSEDISYKQKFEKEKGKCLQLQVKLKGYHTVASQCPELIKQNNILKQELRRLKEGQNQEKEFLGLFEQSYEREKQISESSSSFEIINHDNSSTTPAKLTQGLPANSEHISTPYALQQNQVLKSSKNQTSSEEVQQVGAIDSSLLHKDQTSQASESKEEQATGDRKKELTSSEILELQNNSNSQISSADLASSNTSLVHQKLLKPSVALCQVNSKQSIEMETQEESKPPSPYSQPWGQGARPKDTNVLNWLQNDQDKNVTSSPDVKNTSDKENLGSNSGAEYSAWLRNNVENVPTSSTHVPQSHDKDRLGMSPGVGDIKIPPFMSGLSMPENSTDTNEIYFQNQNANSEASPLVKPEMKSLKLDDLMSFSGMKTSPSPSSSSKGEGVKQQNQVVSFPTDDQEPQLASQAHSMVARMKSGAPTPAGMSSMLYEFAQTAAGMEKKITEYQALIQRQQVQLQGLNQQSSSEDHQRLKEENRNLLALLRNQLAIPSTQETHQTTVKSSGHEHELRQKVEELTHTNEQLFRANKEWHSKWQRLQLNTKDDKQNLEKKIQELKGQVSSLTTQVEKLRSELSALDAQEQEAKVEKTKVVQKNFDLNQEKLNISRDLEMVKTQVDELMRLKRRHEAEIATLKSQNEVQPVQARPSEVGEAVLLKQQLGVFHEDFQKERQDRTKAEAKAEKMRKERDAARLELTNKMKKMQGMLSAKDEDINRKGRQVSDLQTQITNLRKEIHRERGKNQVSTSQHVFYPSGGPRSTMIINTGLKDEHLQRHTYPVATSQHLSPEHLPNAWRCQECTFINFPERTVCDICGWQNVGGGSHNGNLYTTGLPEVTSRVDYYIPPPSDVPDRIETG